VVRVSPGWVETEAAVALAKRLAEQAGADYDGGKQIIMKALGPGCRRRDHEHLR
jgi:hypothetical protein